MEEIVLLYQDKNGRFSLGIYHNQLQADYCSSLMIGLEGFRCGNITGSLAHKRIAGLTELRGRTLFSHEIADIVKFS